MNVGIRKTLALFALILFARVAGAKSNGGPLWQESFTVRLAALALLQTLNAELLSHDSATLTLDHWCAVHQLASPAHIAAERVNGVYQAPTDEQRQLLGVSAMLQYLVGDGERRPSSLPLWRIHFPAPRQGRPEELCGQRAATQ